MSSDNPVHEKPAPFRRVFIDDDSYKNAKSLHKLFGNELGHVVAPKGTPREYANFIRGISCRTCGAPPEGFCTTIAGKQTPNHTSRKIDMLAATFAMSKEITIKEEEDIEELL